MIEKKKAITRNCTQCCLAGVFYLLYMMYCNLSRVFCCSCLVILCVFAVLCVYCCFFTLDARLLARSQYPEGPATGHLDTSFSQFPCVYKLMLRWFPTFQVATTCFSCSPPYLNLSAPLYNPTSHGAVTPSVPSGLQAVPLQGKAPKEIHAILN